MLIARALSSTLSPLTPSFNRWQTGLPLPLLLRHRLGGYREYVPPASVAMIAEALWLYNIPARFEAATGTTHRVLPDPAVNIGFVCRRDDHGRPVDARLLVIGPKTRPHVFLFEEGRELVAVKMKLEWVLPVTGLTPSEHRDVTVDVSDVQPRLAASWLPVLAETRTIEEAMAVLTAKVAAYVRHVRHRPVVAARALDLIRGTRGQCTVEQIADRTSVSVRHLRRVVSREAGMSVKMYARTVRLLQAVTTADMYPPTSQLAWARIAADTGFCDQSHLIRECQSLCGFAPGELLRERRTESLRG